LRKVPRFHRFRQKNKLSTRRLLAYDELEFFVGIGQPLHISANFLFADIKRLSRGGQ
jgi:hypothetical protein